MREPNSDGASGEPKRFVIVGGGPAGVASALPLAGRGVEADLYEKQERLGGYTGAHEMDRFLKREGERLHKRLPAFERSFPCAASILDPPLLPALPHLFYAKDQNKHFDWVFQRGKIPEDPAIYLVAPTRTDPSKAPVVEGVLTPVDIERMYNSNAGSSYGVVSDWNKNQTFKAPKQSSKYKNLFSTDGSVNPGGGMPIAILCGQKVSDRVVTQEAKSR
ncbi:MAG: diapolycopene oxygenase [Akkermansiaceae bacterium]|jgi:phytoene dehydrogenase-like protein